MKPTDLGVAPDMSIVDDPIRLDDSPGNVRDVSTKFLGNGPVVTMDKVAGRKGS